jgi:hypothetical protein
MANPCIFCGDDRDRLSDEHVVADWISDLFSAYPTGIAQLVGSDGRIRQWDQVPFQQKVKVVCEKCNTGWMASLEREAKPILTPMLLGQRQEVRPRTQKLLALWVVKTALVMEHLQPKARVIPDSEYRSLYLSRSPLPTHLVWLGHQTVPRDRTGDLLGAVRKQPITHMNADPASEGQILQWVSEGRKMYRMTFRVGNLVAQVFGHDFPISLNIEGPPQQAQLVRRIWPITGRFKWPPPRSLDEIGGLEGLHRAFDQRPAHGSD